MIAGVIEAGLRSAFVGLTAMVWHRVFRSGAGAAQGAALEVAAPGRSGAHDAECIAKSRLFLLGNPTIVRPEESTTLLQELQAMLQARSGSGEPSGAMPKRTADADSQQVKKVITPSASSAASANPDHRKPSREE